MLNKSKKIMAKLIANPGSGTVAGRGKLLEDVSQYLKERHIKVDVVVAKPKEKAIPIAKKAVKDGYKLIIGMGGDDTIEAIIRGLAGSKARLGIIPVGTANNLAKSLGIPNEPEAACDLIAKGDFRKLDYGIVKKRKGKKIPFFELVTVGIAAAIYPDAVHARKGRLSSVRGVIQKVLQHEARPKITMKMDGESNVTVETMLAIITNVPLIGPNMLIDPNALMDDGYFDISMYPGFSKTELLAYSTRVMNSHAAEDGKIQRYRARTIKVKSSPKLEVMADGIMLGKGTVKIKIKSGTLRVIAPEAGSGMEKSSQEAGHRLPAPVAPTGVKTPELVN